MAATAGSTPLPATVARAAERVLLVVNANASRVSPRRRDAVYAALAARHRVDVVRSDSPRHATELAAAAADSGHTLVVAFGGDGTMSAVARGLLGTDIPLACVGGGYTDVFARTLGMPRDPEAAADRIARTARASGARSVSLGTVDGRPFLFVAGIGFSAALMERIEAGGAEKTGLGSLYAGWHVAATVVRTLRRGAAPFTIDVGGRVVEAITVLAQNSDPLTYLGRLPVRVSPAARLGPPGLSVVAVRSADARMALRTTLRALTGRPDAVVAQPQAVHWPLATEARIASLAPEGVAVEADGDYFGRRAEVRLGVTESKLRLLV